MSLPNAPNRIPRVLLAVPAADAAVIRKILIEESAEPVLCPDLAALCRQIRQEADVVILLEEILGDGGLALLVDTLQRQPNWSDLPLIIVARGGTESPLALGARQSLSNILVLERPIKLAALASSIRMALRARVRQYQVRDLLQSLARNEARYRSFVEATAHVVWRMNARGEADEPMPSWNAFTGQTHEQATGFGWLEAIHPDDRARVLEAWNQAAASRGMYEVEYRLGISNGRWRRILARGVPVLEPDGSVREFIGTCMDISAQRTAEEALRRSEEKFRAVFEQAAVGIGRVRFTDAHWEDANEAFCRMLGYTREEMLATPWPQMTHPEDVDIDLVPFGRMAAGELDRYSVEKRFIHKDGHPVWARLNLSLVRDAQGHPDYEIAVIENIEGRKQAEEAFARERAFLEAVLKACPAGVIVAEPGGKLVRMNPANQRLWGMAPFSESVEQYRDWKGWWADGSARQGRRLEPQEWALARALRGEVCPGDIVDIEPFGAPDTRRTMLNSGAPVIGEQGEIIGAVIVQINITDLRRAEEALRESEQRFRLLVEGASDAVLLHDAEGRFVEVNHQACENLGYTREELLRMEVTDIEQDLDAADLQDLWAHLAVGQPRTIYGHHRRKDGTTFPVEIRINTFNVGSRHLFLALARDITQRKLAEDQLRASEERLRRAISTPTVGVLFFSLNGRIHESNAAFQRMCGYSSDELTAIHWKVLTSPEDWGVTARVAEELATRGETAPYEKQMVRKDDSRWWGLFAPVRLAGNGNSSECMEFIVDITEQKRAQEALQRRTLHLQLLHQASGRLLVGQQPVELLRELHGQMAENFGADVFVLYQDGRGDNRLHLVACTGASNEGRQRLATLRHGCAICANPAEALQPILAMDIQSRRAPNCRLVRKLGFRSYLYYPLVLNNHLHGTLAFASYTRDSYDASDLDFFHTIAATLAEALARQRLETELQRHAADLERIVQQRTAKLQEMVAELEHFSYTITHDMRAPLRAMRGLGGILLEEGGTCLDGEPREYLRRIAEAADRMDKLITDALQYSTVVRGEFPLYPVDSGALLAGILDSYPQFQPPHINLRVEGPLPIVLANEAGLTQCFSNLLGNAVKFVHPGQTPEVRVWAEQVEGRRFVPRGESELPEHEPNAMSLTSWNVSDRAVNKASSGPLGPGTVRIWFEDRGIGIQREYHDKIWVMFQRLNKNYGGTGIGLALVRKAVERMGGRVGVESEPGKGSRFWVELRRADDRAEVSEEENAADS